MINRINSIFELDNNKKYVVLNQAVYEGVNYYLLARITDDEKDILNELIICEEKEKNGVIGVEVVSDPKLLELLAKYLKPIPKNA